MKEFVATNSGLLLVLAFMLGAVAMIGRSLVGGFYIRKTSEVQKKIADSFESSDFNDEVIGSINVMYDVPWWVRPMVIVCLLSVAGAIICFILSLIGLFL